MTFHSSVLSLSSLSSFFSPQPPTSCAHFMRESLATPHHSKFITTLHLSFTPFPLPKHLRCIFLPLRCLTTDAPLIADFLLGFPGFSEKGWTAVKFELVASVVVQPASRTHWFLVLFIDSFRRDEQQLSRYSFGPFRSNNAIYRINHALCIIKLFRLNWFSSCNYLSLLVFFFYCT